MPHGYLPDLNAEYDYTTDLSGTVIEAQIRIEAKKFFDEHWPTSLLIKDYHQWHCSHCGGIFKQDSEPAISYCPWCGRKFVDSLLSKNFTIPTEMYRLSPKDICQAKHGVSSCVECEDCKDCRDVNLCQ